MRKDFNLLNLFFMVGLFLNILALQSQNMTYLALGDSYTIGEAVETQKNWPNVLTKQLEADGFSLQKPKIIAVTGWRTDELISAIEKENLAKKYDLVSLLIGVNNQYQKKDINQYKNEFEHLIQIGLSKSKYNAQGMFVVSIPDYGVSDFAKKKELQKVAEEIATYNKIAKQIAEKYNIVFYNITPISKSIEGNKSMFAEDKLHPSAEQYQLWVDVFYEKVKNQLQTLVKQ
ncbi:SGNH/GDSL hydrolase family protein [Psychroflexus salis]|uniref:Lysophospholipase n=1 Tax=Psychroflexus salis TaxID=1526574 RepID=A0A917EB59_9FLAO|nr:SGNH/GDSL hydrolase family protein [Psychroflexus salis]GGE20865.1 lysophospholipase [Psychroflexus salis]